MKQTLKINPRFQRHQGYADLIRWTVTQELVTVSTTNLVLKGKNIQQNFIAQAVHLTCAINTNGTWEM